jgi:nitrite reductase/ring-hydroxylating ferredoxin subunit
MLPFVLDLRCRTSSAIPLRKGRRDRHRNAERDVVAAAHGWLFEIKTGQSWWEGPTHARSDSVVVEAGEELARGPFQAETVPVAVEDRYIVLEF